MAVEIKERAADRAAEAEGEVEERGEEIRLVDRAVQGTLRIVVE